MHRAEARYEEWNQCRYTYDEFIKKERAKLEKEKQADRLPRFEAKLACSCRHAHSACLPATGTRTTAPRWHSTHARTGLCAGAAAEAAGSAHARKARCLQLRSLRTEAASARARLRELAA